MASHFQVSLPSIFMSNYFLLPLISTVTGCLITWILSAILLNRLPELLQKLLQSVSGNLLNTVDLLDSLAGKTDFQTVRPLIEGHIDEFLQHKLGREMPMIGMFIGDKTIAQLKGIFMKELEEIFPPVIEKYISNLLQNVDYRQIISKKIASLSKQKLRSFSYDLLGARIRLAPLFGAIGGLFIGLIQLIVLLAIA